MLALILAFLSVMGPGAGGVREQATNKPRPDRVTIQRRRIVLVRPPSVARHFPEKRTAIVTYPVVSGLTDPTVLRRVRSALAFKNIFEYSLEEYREIAWLSEFSYVVNYNRDYLLDITFTQTGAAAYPDEQTKHFLINLKDGNIVKASEAFEYDTFERLAARVDSKLQLEIKQIVEANSTAGDSDPEGKKWAKEAHEILKFEVQNLDDFSVGRRGITFLYDAGFPHAIKAFEPQGKYFFSYSELKPFIKRDGLLGQFID